MNRRNLVRRIEILQNKQVIKDDSVYKDVLSYFGEHYEGGKASVFTKDKNFELVRSFLLDKATNEQILLLESLSDDDLMKMVSIPSAGLNNFDIFVGSAMTNDKIQKYWDTQNYESDMWSYELFKNCISNLCVTLNLNTIYPNDTAYGTSLVDHIRTSIYSSKFSLFDLTTHNPGVYYELGYAHSLGRHVILTCLKEDFDECHFDIKQLNIIVYDDFSDLFSKLNIELRSVLNKYELKPSR